MLKCIADEFSEVVNSYLRLRAIHRQEQKRLSNMYIHWWQNTPSVFDVITLGDRVQTYIFMQKFRQRLKFIRPCFPPNFRHSNFRFSEDGNDRCIMTPNLSSPLWDYIMYGSWHLESSLLLQKVKEIPEGSPTNFCTRSLMAIFSNRPIGYDVSLNAKG
jgi:hypothetical protein